MIRPGRLLGLLVLVLGLGCLASGCVRLNEPGQFICNTDGDCESGEKCRSGVCGPKDACSYDSDCEPRARCRGTRCVAVECEWSTAASDCGGYACLDGDCTVGCNNNSDCASGFHCDASTCVAGAVKDDGSACTKDADCASRKCCAQPSGSVCTTFCAAVPDDSCLREEDCLSGICCIATNGKAVCSSVPCAERPQCVSDTDCQAPLICKNAKCVQPPPLKATGQACKLSSECASNSCFEGFCRGKGKGNDKCVVESDCEPTRRCCENQYAAGGWFCGELNRGCPGSIGAACESDFECIENECLGPPKGFCSKPCTTNDDCGVSPWGVPNACETNGEGNRVCFPGCTSSQQCWDNLDQALDCLDAFDSNATICAEN